MNAKMFIDRIRPYLITNMDINHCRALTLLRTQTRPDIEVAL